MTGLRDNFDRMLFDRMAPRELKKIPVNIRAYLERRLESFREFAGDISSSDPSRRVYISPLDEYTGQIAGLAAAYLNNNGVPTVLATYRDDQLHLPRSVQPVRGPNRLILIDYERNPELAERLHTAGMLGSELHVTDILYSWWYPRADMLHIDIKQSNPED